MRNNDRDNGSSNFNPQRLVIDAQAQDGHGKTNLWTTAQRPILALSIDPNTETVVKNTFGEASKHLDPEVLKLVHIPFPMVGFDDENAVANQATDSWNLLTDEITDVIRGRCDVMPKVVALDTGTEIAELNILTKFGRTDKISPKMRQIYMGDLNSRFKGLLRGLEHAGVHVIITHRVRERWETVEVRTKGGTEEKDQRVPGAFDRICAFKQMGNFVNTTVLMLFDPDRSDRLSERFGIKIIKSTIRPAVVGDEYWGKEDVGEERVKCASFPFIGTLLFPDSSLDDWR